VDFRLAALLFVPKWQNNPRCLVPGFDGAIFSEMWKEAPPPSYVKPFVKRQKNDSSDAEAICEAAQRPTMRFVAVKSEAAQASAAIFRTRDLLVRQRTQHTRCLVPGFDGAIFSHVWKEALWARFFTAAPPRQRPGATASTRRPSPSGSGVVPSPISPPDQRTLAADRGYHAQ
jgi:hypothetical protein